ncbi:MAG: MFS transporter, partial [Candidatus Competibacteraceae bacterium]|nr:MFS transporter [Candidatus Competibacteraceae bacterium]
MPARTPATRVALAVLVICTGFNLFARGISETFAVFLIPLELEFGWPRATLTGIYSLFMLTNGLASPLAG